MSLSPSERRDWLLLAGMALAVYAALRPARLLFDALTRAGWLATMQQAIVATVVLLGAGFLSWMIWRTGVRDPRCYLNFAGLGLAAAGVLVLLTKMPIERFHLLEYGLVGWLAWRVAGHRFVRSDRALIGGLMAFNIGLGDELIQGVLPTRFYDPKDVLVNGVAGAIGVWAAALLVSVNRRQETE